MGAQRSSDERQEVDEISAIRERLVALEQLLAGQQQQMAQQEAEIERLRSALAGAQDTPALILPAATKRNQLAALASRRSLLKLGGVAAAAGGAAPAVSVARNGPAGYRGGTAGPTGPVRGAT